jgi:hypothetical protein
VRPGQRDVRMALPSAAPVVQRAGRAVSRLGGPHRDGIRIATTCPAQATSRRLGIQLRAAQHVHSVSVTPIFHQVSRRYVLGPGQGGRAGRRGTSTRSQVVAAWVYAVLEHSMSRTPRHWRAALASRLNLRPHDLCRMHPRAWCNVAAAATALCDPGSRQRWLAVSAAGSLQTRTWLPLQGRSRCRYPADLALFLTLLRPSSRTFFHCPAQDLHPLA